MSIHWSESVIPDLDDINDLYLQRVHNASSPIEVEVTLNCGSAEESKWMQGLLLALSEESLGELESCGDGWV